MKYRIVISTVFVAVVLALLARSEYISAQDCTMPSDAITIEEVTVWRNQYSHADHQERWDKVLAALGVDNGKAKMTVADAQTHHGTYPNARWERTVRTLQAIYCVPPTSTSTPTPTLTPTPVPPTSTPTPQPAAQDCTMPSDAVTVQEVKGWRDGHSGAEHKLRWNRVLKALGEDVDVAPMTVADSEANESKFMASRWGRVTRTLKFLACSVPPTATPVVVVPPTATPITVLPAQADQQDSQQDQPKAQSDKQQQQVACSITWEGGGSTITRREGYSVYNTLIVRGTTQTCLANGFPGHSVCARVLIDGSDQGSLNPPNYVYMDDLSIRFSPRENQKKVHHIAGARWGGGYVTRLIGLVLLPLLAIKSGLAGRISLKMKWLIMSESNFRYGLPIMAVNGRIL